MQALDTILRDTYHDFLKESTFFSYMDGEDYDTIIKKDIPQGNCHILSKVLQTRLKDILVWYDNLSVDIIGPSISHNGSLYPEYQYHTAVLVHNYQNNIVYLLDPWSLFVDPLLLNYGSSEYNYLCLGNERNTSLLVENDNIIHTTQYLKKTLMAVLDINSLEDHQLKKLFEDHQLYEKSRYNPKRPQRKFIYHKEDRNFVLL